MSKINCFTDRQTDQVIEYSVLRALVMILVVVGHCTYYTIAGPSEYGGIDYAGIMKTAGIMDTHVHAWTSVLTMFIYTFHMPLFMSISGAVFELGWNKGKYRDSAIFVKKKIRRLLVPFFGVTLFYAVPLKYLSGYWHESSDVLRDIFIGQFLVQGNTHLWFLLTLFFEFLIFYLFLRQGILEKRYQYILFVILLLTCFVAKKVPIKLISYVLEFGIYFYVGILFERYRKVINAHVALRWVITLLLLWFILFVAHYGLAHPSSFVLKGIKRLDEILMAFIGMMTFYAGMVLALRKQMLTGKWVSLLSRDSMGIYLYSDPLNYVILASFAVMFSIAGFGNEFLSAALYSARLILTFFGGLVVTLAIRYLSHQIKF